ncbi:hypothetical protein B0H17DRAFT_958106 [Mycena rosella]|uniref:Uncharacterized protein n=1 Tax=Mycena rosella TaxID=1033263 RepID=A0AAD7G398_MYCRO|nr:hypothetical protein B0H17DRAFT_958106 [Mycena rosella]
MDVSLEAYRNIVRNVGRRRDIAALCGVSRGFQRVAERALYNTLTVSDADPRLCETLAGSPRIAGLVVALTVQVRRRGQAREDEDGDSQDSASEEKEEQSAPAGPSAGAIEPGASIDGYWAAVAGALRNATRLRHLTIDIADPADAGTAWVLDECVFQLRTFYCDFDWDEALRAFLATQHQLHDLSLRDYRELALDAPDDGQPADTHDTTEPSHTLESDIPPATHDTISIHTTLPQPIPAPAPALPQLDTLECTFSEAAVALIPGRPLARLKTCFSRPDLAGKRAELAALLAALRISARPLRALDLADAAYTEAGAMELLHRISHTPATARELRYLGTLVLPVGGARCRLHFYGLLMRLRRLRCIEVDVSAWTPPPTSSPAFRAVAAELRLYCPDMHTVVFVHEFERTVVTAVAGVLRINADANPELFWREI